METRGRKQNGNMIINVHRLKDEGKLIPDIADILGISIPMVRYFLRQEAKPTARKESLVTCFFRQPKEVQKVVARMIGYILPEETDNSDIPEKYKELGGGVEENSLLDRVEKLFRGEIKMNEVEENFTYDERKRLSQIDVFNKTIEAILKHNPLPCPLDEVILELTKCGL